MSDEVENIERFAAQLIVEAEGLLRLLPAVSEMQWESSPAYLGEDDGVRVANMSGAPADPVADTVTDPQRMALRLQVQRSERLMRDALIRVRGVRRGLEIRMVGWETGTPRA
jgi:hypothetical protein